MIDFLYEMRDFWIWCASLLVLTAILWAVPRTRRMPGIMMTGWKTMPAGCAGPCAPRPRRVGRVLPLRLVCESMVPHTIGLGIHAYGYLSSAIV